MSQNETIERDGLTVTAIPSSNLGNKSYVVDDGSRALVIDPPRDIDRVQAVLRDRGVELAATFETHIHADVVSGGLELARSSNVPYVVPCEAEVAYEHTQVCDEDVRTIAGFTVATIGTPGHTPHHVSYAIGQGEQPAFVFTGGSMLFGSVGRPDLVDPKLTEQLAHAQYHSVRRLVDELPGDTAVLPTHGFGSFCSATPTTGTESTVEQQRTQNPALTQDEQEFVSTLLAGLDAYPSFYAHLPAINRQGPAPVDLSPAAEADAAELRRRIEAGEWVVDLRDKTVFARGHVSGSYSFDANGNMVTYLGWLRPWDIPVTLIGESPEQVADAQRELVRIGIDRPAAQATAPVEQLTGDRPLARFDTVTFTDVADKADRGRVTILDVRRNAEWTDGHIAGARHIPLHELLDRVDEVGDEPVWVHCASGFRATIAASILDAAGKDVTAIVDDFEQAEKAGLQLTAESA
jgi:hydroxyacylglutathione hydrolase